MTRFTAPKTGAAVTPIREISLFNCTNTNLWFKTSQGEWVPTEKQLSPANFKMLAHNNQIKKALKEYNNGTIILEELQEMEFSDNRFVATQKAGYVFSIEYIQILNVKKRLVRVFWPRDEEETVAAETEQQKTAETPEVEMAVHGNELPTTFPAAYPDNMYFPVTESRAVTSGDAQETRPQLNVNWDSSISFQSIGNGVQAMEEAPAQAESEVINDKENVPAVHQAKAINMDEANYMDRLTPEDIQAFVAKGDLDKISRLAVDLLKRGNVYQHKYQEAAKQNEQRV